MQYTLRNVPPSLDDALRRRARRTGKSLNETLLQVLAEALGFGARDRPVRNLEDVAGTWQDDRAFDAAIEDQDRVDEELWR